jgi:hypothetical protein
MYLGKKRRMEAVAAAKKALELGNEEAKALLENLGARPQGTA